jgi:hypothetical protein
MTNPVTGAGPAARTDCRTRCADPLGCHPLKARFGVPVLKPLPHPRQPSQPAEVAEPCQ